MPIKHTFKIKTFASIPTLNYFLLKNKLHLSDVSIQV